MKPAPFDYLRAGSLAEAHEALAAEGGDAAVIAGGQTLVPLLSMRMARPKAADRHHACRGTGRHRGRRTTRSGSARRCGRPHCWRGPSLRSASRCWRSRCPGSATRRPARAAPSAARSRTPIRAPKSRWRCVALGGEIELSSGQGKRRVTADDFFTGMMSHRAQRRRTDRGGALSLRAGRAKATPSASSRGGMATSPSSPAPRSRRATACGSRSAASPTARLRATSARSTAARSTTRSNDFAVGARRARRPARHRRAIAATWCASSAAPPSRRRAACRA